MSELFLTQNNMKNLYKIIQNTVQDKYNFTIKGEYVKILQNNMMRIFQKNPKNKYPNLKVGFSNHYNGLTALIGATALNSECLEFHITKDRTMYGSDQVASIESVTELMVSVRKLETMLGDGEKVVYDSEVPIAKKLRKVNDICQD